MPRSRFKQHDPERCIAKCLLQCTRIVVICYFSVMAIFLAIGVSRVKETPKDCCQVSQCNVT